MNMVNVICYKTKTPVVYNKGTTYEKSCDHFLCCYGYIDEEANKRLVDSLNNDPEKFRAFCEERRLNPDNVTYFYHHRQEAFDTRD